ncbi:pyruvate formate lyase family protein [Moorella naiadis]|uniref:pyruvate formate lyase family protein n=1 Tax=Moorella naiadis (nom. illeg.) TaxID=3093670 RepID=UPI003D9C8E49
MDPRIELLKARALAVDRPVSWITLEQIKARARRETEVAGLPPALASAAVFKAIMQELPIDIGPDDCLVGSQEAGFRPTYELYKGLDDPEDIPADVQDHLSADPYDRQAAALLTEAERWAQEEALCIGKRVLGHMVPDFTRVLGRGLLGLQEEIAGQKNATGNQEKQLYYQSMAETLTAVILLAHRYRDLALKLAQVETVPRRRAELETIAGICERVPARPARTFREALQAVWLVWQAMVLEQAPNAYAFSLGRLDQFLYPYYQADISSGRLSRAEALALLEEFWLKFVVGSSCWAVSQNILVGGQKADGSDAANELTELCLEATAELRTPQPSLAFRYHPGCRAELFYKVCELMKLGLGIPSIHNDTSVIAAMTAVGIPLEAARDYAIAGCQEFVVPGQENARTTGGKFNLLKCLELALNDGVSAFSGRRLGPATGKLTAMTSFDELMAAFQTQVESAIDLMVAAHNKTDRLLAEMRPTPFLSCLYDDCITTGRDVRADGACYNFTGVLTHGLGSTVDALMAVKKLVFDTGQVSPAALRQALDADFAGHEDLRQLLINGAPKYGNDIDEVDKLAAAIVAWFTTTLARRQNAWGGIFKAGFNTPSSHVLYGRYVAATPDGRRKGEPMSYGTGPYQGRNQNGPTATLRSVTSFPHRLATNGTDLSLSLQPDTIKGREGTEKLAALLQTYCDLGGHHIMLNIVDVETLRAAQRRPELYRHLVVRVHGFSTYFIALDPAIQEDVITRVASGL